MLIATRKGWKWAAAKGLLALAGLAAATMPLTPAAWAADDAAGDSGAAAGNAARPAAPPASPASLLELERLKLAVEAQSRRLADHIAELESDRAVLADDLERIVRLEEAFGGAGDASEALEADLASAEAGPGKVAQGIRPAALGPARPQAGQTQGSVDRRLLNLEQRLKKIGPLSFSGDFRFREEPSFGGPADRSLQQNRQRYRLRFNTEADLGAGVTGGFSTASGDINNPISTNQDVTGFYARKALSLDKAFVQYNPEFFKPLTLVAGKFSYPWFNTELVWDKDLNPEGLAQTLAFNLNSTRVLKRIAVIGFELPFSQVAGVQVQNKSVMQSAMYGGQVQSTWQLTPWLTFSAYEAFYNFRNADPIAFAIARASMKNPQTPLSGALPLAAGSGDQNSITTTISNGIVTVNGSPSPTGIATIANAQFASKFALLDTIGRLDVRTKWERWPISFIGDFVQNTQACANVKNILPAPANTTTAQFTQSTNFACDPRQRRGYWAEVEVGRILEKHDWQFGYTRMFIEREAVLANFNYSEIRLGTNVSEHRVSAFYTIRHNVVLDWIGLFGRPLNFGSSAPPERFVKRLQFDINYAF